MSSTPTQRARAESPKPQKKEPAKEDEKKDEKKDTPKNFDSTMAALHFPRLPPWPPSWSGRTSYIHWWLCLFMTGVGGLKAAGFLAHDLSRIVGVLELLGGLVLLPGWPTISSKVAQLSLPPPIGIKGERRPSDKEEALRLGACTVLFALGIIVSTPKWKSPICWSQILLTFDLLRSRPGLQERWGGRGSGLVYFHLGFIATFSGIVTGFALRLFF